MGFRNDEPGSGYHPTRPANKPPKITTLGSFTQRRW
jgi:hypothetical protein